MKLWGGAQGLTAAMNWRSRILVGAATLVGLGALAGAVYSLVAEPWAQRLRLPSGATLTLWGVTHGKQHEFDDRQGWRRFVPAATAGNTRPGLRSGPIFTHPTETESLVAWIAHQRHGPGKRLEGPLEVVGPVDEHGCVFGSVPRYWQGAPERSRLGSLSPLPLRAFPRRGGSAWLEVREGLERKLLGRFGLGSPVAEDYPSWTPEPLPAARRVGEVEVTLESLRHVEGPYAGTRAGFSVREQGRYSWEWAPFSIAVSDATGNILEGPAGLATTVPGLCRKESAWKLRVALGPSPRGRGSRPDHTWTVRDIAVPTARGRTRCGQIFEKNGLWLRLDDIAGKDVIRTMEASAPARLGVSTSSPEGIGVRLLRATDDRGRNVLPSVPLLWDDPDPRLCRMRGERGFGSFPLEIPADAGSLDLTFGIYEPRIVEFFARP